MWWLQRNGWFWLHGSHSTCWTSIQSLALLHSMTALTLRRGWCTGMYVCVCGGGVCVWANCRQTQDEKPLPSAATIHLCQWRSTLTLIYISRECIVLLGHQCSYYEEELCTCIYNQSLSNCLLIHLQRIRWRTVVCNIKTGNNSSEWVVFNIPSTHYIMSVQTGVFPVNHLHWYLQLSQNNNEKTALSRSVFRWKRNVIPARLRFIRVRLPLISIEPSGSDCTASYIGFAATVASVIC